MKLSSLMQTFQSYEYSLQDISNHILRDFFDVLEHEISQGATIHILNEHKQ
jgi:hypothetical protein